MRCATVILCSFTLLSTLHARQSAAAQQSTLTEQQAADAIADEFVANLKRAPGFDAKTWGIVLTKLTSEEAGLQPLPDGNVGVSGAGSTTGLSFRIGTEITDTGGEKAISFALARIRQQLPWIRFDRSDEPGALTKRQASLAIGVGEVQWLQRSFDGAAGYSGRMAALLQIGERQNRIEKRFGLAQPAFSQASTSAHVRYDHGLWNIQSCIAMGIVILVLFVFLKMITRGQRQLTLIGVTLGAAMLAALAALVIGAFSVRQTTQPSPNAMIRR